MGADVQFNSHYNHVRLPDDLEVQKTGRKQGVFDHVNNMVTTREKFPS